MQTNRDILVALLTEDKIQAIDVIKRKKVVSILADLDVPSRTELIESLEIDDRKQLAKMLTHDQKEHPKLQEDARAFKIIEEWVSEHDFSIIQRNEAPRAHKIAEAIQNRTIYPLSHPYKEKEREDLINVFTKVPSIVVRHNWLAAIGDDLREKDGEPVDVSLPYPSVLFEFKFHGKCVVLMASEQEDGRVGLLPIVEFEKDKWFICTMRDELLFKLHNAVCKQVEAICVALTVQIAESEEIHQPEAINRKRLKNKKLPLRSYHVVDLSKRFQDKKMRRNGVKSTDDGPKVRLHWRRRHWRHFKSGRPPIEIDWMLVGDIDLGFIEKHYLM